MINIEFENVFKSLNAISIPVDGNKDDAKYADYFKIVKQCIPANLNELDDQDAEEYYIHMLSQYIGLYASNCTSTVNAMLMQNYNLSIKDYFTTYNELPF